MKSRHILAAAALALTGVAASASPSVFDDMPSTMSRAEVLAQVDQLRADGRMLRANDAYGAVDAPTTITSAAPLSRDEVLNDLVASRASGEFDARGETYGNFAWNQFGNIEQPLPEQASVVAAREEAEAAAALAAATLADDQPVVASEGLSADMSATSEPVVLWVPTDGEAITLQPGEAMLLVPSDDATVPDAE